MTKREHLVLEFPGLCCVFPWRYVGCWYLTLDWTQLAKDDKQTAEQRTQVVYEYS